MHSSVTYDRSSIASTMKKEYNFAWRFRRAIMNKLWINDGIIFSPEFRSTEVQHNDHAVITHLHDEDDNVNA